MFCGWVHLSKVPGLLIFPALSQFQGISVLVVEEMEKSLALITGAEIEVQRGKARKLAYRLRLVCL